MKFLAYTLHPLSKLRLACQYYDGVDSFINIPDNDHDFRKISGVKSFVLRFKRISKYAKISCVCFKKTLCEEVKKAESDIPEFKTSEYFTLDGFMDCEILFDAGSSEFIPRFHLARFGVRPVTPFVAQDMIRLTRCNHVSSISRHSANDFQIRQISDWIRLSKRSHVAIVSPLTLYDEYCAHVMQMFELKTRLFGSIHTVFSNMPSHLFDDEYTQANHLLYLSLSNPTSAYFQYVLPCIELELHCGICFFHKSLFPIEIDFTPVPLRSMSEFDLCEHLNVCIGNARFHSDIEYLDMVCVLYALFMSVEYPESGVIPFGFNESMDQYIFFRRIKVPRYCKTPFSYNADSLSAIFALFHPLLKGFVDKYCNGAHLY